MKIKQIHKFMHAKAFIHTDLSLCELFITRLVVELLKYFKMNYLVYRDGWGRSLYFSIFIRQIIFVCIVILKKFYIYFSIVYLFSLLFYILMYVYLVITKLFIVIVTNLFVFFFK